MTICNMPSAFLTAKREISERIGWSLSFQKNLYDKAAIDHTLNFRQPQIFRREAISKNKLNTPKFYGAKRLLSPTSVQIAYDGGL